MAERAVREILSQSLSYWTSGGLLLVPLALVCFAIWAYFLRSHGQLTKALATPPNFEDRLAEDVRRESLEENVARYGRMRGVFPATVASVLKAVCGGASAAGVFDECEHAHLDRFERDLLVLAALTVVAPLLGLLGTVRGMIETFQAVSSSAGQTTDKVASGISQALITTQFGLVIAIPGVFGLARLQRVLDQVKIRFASCRTHLLLALEQSEYAA